MILLSHFLFLKTVLFLFQRLKITPKIITLNIWLNFLWGLLLIAIFKGAYWYSVK